jgi:sugar phosphate isomerase/epimerase
MAACSRRAFLQQSVFLGAAGAVALQSEARAGTRRGEQMRFGLVTYQWGDDWDLPTLIANCTKAQVHGLELRTTHAHRVEPNLNAVERREVKRRFADSPIILVGLGTNENFHSPDRQQLRKSIEAVKAFIRLGHDVGGSGVKVKPDSFPPGVPREQTIRQIGQSLNELGGFGADYGQQIRLEVHGTCSALPVIRAIIDVADHPNVAVCWNSNRTDLAGGGLEYNFVLVERRLGATAHVRPLDSADYPFPHLIRLFVKIDYRGWILLEAGGKPADRVGALAAQAALFRKLVTQAQARR